MASAPTHCRNVVVGGFSCLLRFGVQALRPICGADVSGLWPEWISQLHPPTACEPACNTVLCPTGASHLAAFLFTVQLIGGLLLLSGFFMPLAPTVLAAELYNILAFHLTLAPANIVPALVAAVLWALIFLQYRASRQRFAFPLRRQRNQYSSENILGGELCATGELLRTPSLAALSRVNTLD
jgi:hypothetical protein